MIKAATVGVNDHKTHIAKPGVSSRNLINKAAPTDMHSTRTEKMAALFVSGSFVNISRSPSLAEEPARRSCLAAVVGRVATPDLGGGQVAVSPSHATFACHVMSTPYSCPRGMYVRQGTKLAEELRRTPYRRSSRKVPMNFVPLEHYSW